MKNSVLLLLIGVTSSLINADDPTLVTLPEGQIRGKELLSPNDKVYYAFQEIPYASPPVGELRFKAPVAPTPWKGILNTTENTKMCYQRGGLVKIFGLTESEDCLYLNVYTPVKPGDPSESPLPILVWIHGGSLLNGAGAFQKYKPYYFIAYDVVVVTINYRLGPLGFLTTEDGIIPGNIGLRDQHLAIQWVKKNIALFGGDPEKISVTGESAGATSVGFQLLSPRNKGLFRSAILLSNTAIIDRVPQRYARFYAFELGKSLNSTFTSNDSNDLLAILQSVAAAEINNNTITPVAGKEIGIVEAGGLIWVPVIEDPSLEDIFLTGAFHEDIRTGNMNQVPILIGFNSQEQLTYMHFDPTKPERLAKYFDKDLKNLVRNKFNMTEEDKLTVGNKLRDIYTEGAFEGNLSAVVNFFSDETYITPIIRHAKLQSNYTDVFLYQFSYKGKMGGLPGIEVAGVRGVGHAEDLGYLWDARLTVDHTPDDPGDILTRHRLLTMWTNFVKYLNPTPHDDNLLGNVKWVKVASNNLVYLNINSTLEMQINPKQYLKWEKIIDTYTVPPLISY